MHAFSRLLWHTTVIASKRMPVTGEQQSMFVVFVVDSIENAAHGTLK
jgi:hypothetical protein